MDGEILTIGYQEASREAVVRALVAAGTCVLVDTRDMPNSRRAEFRPGPLAAAVEAAGIRYVSMRSVGAPKPLRVLAKTDWPQFVGAYRERLAGLDPELRELAALIQAERSCLLCYEADALACHRSFLAEELRGRTGLDVVHLRPTESERSERPGRQGRIAS